MRRTLLVFLTAAVASLVGCADRPDVPASPQAVPHSYRADLENSIVLAIRSSGVCDRLMRNRSTPRSCNRAIVWAFSDAGPRVQRTLVVREVVMGEIEAGRQR